MRSAAILLLMAVLAGILVFGAPRPALGEDRLEIPREPLGFRGTLSGEVVKAPDKTYGWFEMKVVKVVSLSRGNQSSLKSSRGLTRVWKDKCVAVLGVKGMPELKVGDMVTVVAFNHEKHLRSTRVSKDRPPEAGADGDAKADEKHAGAALQAARKLIDQGKIEKAKEALMEIVEKFPTTKSGEEARKMLEKLDR
jgi:hypothetical protein